MTKDTIRLRSGTDTDTDQSLSRLLLEIPPQSQPQPPASGRLISPDVDSDSVGGVVEEDVDAVVVPVPVVAVAQPPALTITVPTQEEELKINIKEIKDTSSWIQPFAIQSASSFASGGINSSISDQQNNNKSTKHPNKLKSHHYSERDDPFRRVQRVSRHAALTTKQQLWDSNAASIDAALSAVNQWEIGYCALRSLVVAGAVNAGNLYGAAKEQASKLEHGLLKPIRDWILLPALWGMEKAACETVGLVQQHHRGWLTHSHRLARSVPYVGDSILAPTLTFSVEWTRRTWEIAQYPIPSKQQVVQTVDSALTGTKWALSVFGREVQLYMKRGDAILTRTLSTTQWKVLGSGPYATLDAVNKAEVIDHLCERYFAFDNDAFARYELAAHIRRHNPPLYQDLVLTGVLKERGKELTQDDEWLSTCPIYRSLETPFLLDCANDSDIDNDNTPGVSALWFRLPNVNGEKPGKDAPWISFRKSEIKCLEKRYLQIVNRGGLEVEEQQQQHEEEESEEKLNDDDGCHHESLKTPIKRGSSAPPPAANKNSSSSIASYPRTHHPTVAQWYDPDLDNDILVDQNRAAVSFLQGCSKCREAIALVDADKQQSRHLFAVQPLEQLKWDALCMRCLSSSSSSSSSFSSRSASVSSPPPLCMVLRPTCWRFHGPGDTVRRATWFLDTARYGLQPFDDEASGILEDAYLFLKWMSLRQAFQTDEDNDIAAILTVEVPCPDGADRLVQFTSLTRATAIQKGLGSAIALFKRRVYRGAWLMFDDDDDSSNSKSLEQRQRDESASLEESLLHAVQTHGALGDTLVPDMSIRSALTPRSSQPEHRLVLFGNHPSIVSLAVSPEQLDETMGKYLSDEKDGKVDHLVLIVHGIGEMLRTIDLFGLSLSNLSSIIDCCAFLRKNHSEVQDAQFSQMYATQGAASLASTGRVEYLPVEWHEAFSILSQRQDHPGQSGTVNPNNDAGRKTLSRSNLAKSHVATSPGGRSSNVLPGNHVMMKDISLRTIPNMREFANDTLLDVLYFMSPEHHDIIIDIVTNEMNVVVERFRNLTGFNGRISVVGHSLGSIISWDILSNQCKVEATTKTGLRDVPSFESIESMSQYFSPATELSYVYGYAPEVTKPVIDDVVNRTKPRPFLLYPQLEFDVDNFFMLGSPVAVFLMIRNQRMPLSEDFSLSGCNRVFNIFHPYDPVAYRLEPCIDPRNAEYEPTIMTHWNGGFRVQYQTKRLWRQFIDTTWKTQQNVVEAFEAGMAAMGLIDSAVDNFDDDVSSSDFSADSRANRVITGALNQGRRIDYMLQEKEIENANEYVAALAAHSSYWKEKDMSMFIARQVCLSKLAADMDSTYAWEAGESD